MYNELRLEKGMYHLANKSFLQALEEADPSAQYAGTPMARLDAYERQLKRFDIRVSGPGCDRVEKFFTTTESAVLFPEFVRRAVLQGMQESVLHDLAAVVTRCGSNRYQGIELTETDAYSTTDQGDPMPGSSIAEASSTVTLSKYGRCISATYEAVRQQKLDVFALMLREVGRELSNSILTDALDVLTDSLTPSNIAGATLTYADLAGLYGKFSGFNMKALLACPSVVADILVMNQMLKASSQDVIQIRLPFGTQLICCQAMDDTAVIGVDTDFALEQIQSSDVVLETDKLIDRQLDCIGVSVNIGFRRLMDGAVKVMELTPAV